MPETILGKVSVTPRGAYDAGTQYEALDAVSHGGGSWMACKASRGVEPGTDPESWMQLAEKGDTGPQGPKGDTGDTGPQGPKGDTGDKIGRASRRERGEASAGAEGSQDTGVER